MNRKKKLLIVDDELGHLTTLKFIFEDNGFDVTMVSSGREAVEKVEKETFDMALLDINMAEMDGLETFREIKKRAPAVSVFMMTGNRDNLQVGKCLEEGAVTVVYKPFSVNSLLKMMEKVSDKPTVLVVDDRGDDRAVLKSVLQLHDFRIVEASSGEEALEKIRKGNYDVCLVDYRMPGMNGVETIEKIREESPEANVVLVSGYTLDEAIKREIEGRGGVAFIKKPFEINNLVDVIRDAKKKKEPNE